MNQTSSLKIVVASVLKPIDDIRMYHKIGRTLLSHLPKAELHVFAYYPSKKMIPSSPSHKVFFYRLFGRGRLHLSRLWVNFRLVYWLTKLRPDCLIITTWELIPTALWLNFFYGTALIYDVQENYAYNLRYTQVYPRYLRVALASFVEGLERLLLLCKPFFLFAEQCYISQKPKMRPYLLLENKCLQSEISSIETQTLLANTEKKILRLLYCGTISKDYGIFDLMNWAEALHQAGEAFELEIIGYAPSANTQIQLKEWAKDKDYIHLQAIDAPVAHFEIMQAIYQAAIVMMPYQVNQSYAQRIPTKFFECLALKKMMCISPNPFWEDYLANYTTASTCFIDFKQPYQARLHWQKIKQTLTQKQSSKDHTVSEDIFWESQTPTLIEQFNKVIAC